ncbi:acyltransferase [bacterium]|nr:acyltransferase [bacterium]
MESKKKSFLNYINVFRGLAILLIIAGHTMQFGESSSLIHKINCEIVCGGTALFIFISGFLFQHLSGKFEYKNYLSKKWTNVILPYFITAIPGILFCLFLPQIYGNSFDGLNPLIQIPMFLTTGRIHNTPTWFIPMIILFFICSWVLLKLEQKGILYKLLPIMLLITLLCPRTDVDYNSIMNLTYSQKYLACLGYIINGFIHFFSLYVFGMFCSKYKDVIDIFYNKRLFLWIFMIGFAATNVYLNYYNIYSNFTISKTILTMLVLGYLKHYDEWLMKKETLNKILDITAKYSFGLFFVHWYWFFIYNQIFGLEKVIPIINNNYAFVFGIVVLRFTFVSIFSMLSLYVSKKLILSINKNANVRMIIGI